MSSVFERVENNVREGENAGYQHFSFSHCVFKGNVFCRLLKDEIIWEKVKKLFFVFIILRQLALVNIVYSSTDSPFLKCFP